jgi:hypothetical protein
MGPASINKSKHFVRVSTENSMTLQQFWDIGWPCPRSEFSFSALTDDIAFNLAL